MLVFASGWNDRCDLKEYNGKCLSVRLQYLDASNDLLVIWCVWCQECIIGNRSSGIGPRLSTVLSVLPMSVEETKRMISSCISLQEF